MDAHEVTTDSPASGGQSGVGEEHGASAPSDGSAVSERRAEPAANGSDCVAGAAVGPVVTVLAKTVAGLQDTMGVAYQRMAGSLQQSLQMMQQMNDCMEHYMQGGLAMKLSPLPHSRGAVSFENVKASRAAGQGFPRPRSQDGRVALGGGGCAVRIVLKNAIKFPMMKMVLTLTCSGAPGDGSDADAVPFVVLQPSAAAKRQRRAVAGDDTAAHHAAGPLLSFSPADDRRSLDEIAEGPGRGTNECMGMDEGACTRWQADAISLEPQAEQEALVFVSFADCAPRWLRVAAVLPSPGTGKLLECKVRALRRLCTAECALHPGIQQ